jgi:hypothetical protein
VWGFDPSKDVKFPETSNPGILAAVAAGQGEIFGHPIEGDGQEPRQTFRIR